MRYHDRQLPTIHNASLKRAMYWLIAVGVLLSFTVTPPLLNEYVNYTIPGGNAAGKVHPATYIAVLLFMLVVLDGITRAPLDRRLRNWIGIFGTHTLYLLLRGKAAYAATIVDIYLTPAILLLGLTRLENCDSTRMPAKTWAWHPAL